MAAVLAVLTVFGCFAALLPRPPDDQTEFDKFGSDVVLAKLTQIEGLGSNTVTAASYANGMHLLANQPTKLLCSTDGKSWQNVLDHPSIAGQWASDRIIDEIVYVDGTWFFGVFGWYSQTDGLVFRFRPGTADNSGLGGEWQASFDGKTSQSGAGVAMEVLDNVLYFVTENGHLYRKTPGGAWYPASESVPAPFAGYRVFDLAKCDNLYLALGEDENGTVLFRASSMTGTWTMKRLNGIKANRFDTTADGACFIACDGGKLAYSSDLFSWKISEMADNVSFTEFFTFGGKYYAIGSDDTRGVLYESTNGATWERVASVDEPLSAVSVAEDAAILYADGGAIYRLTK